MPLHEDFARAWIRGCRPEWDGGDVTDLALLDASFDVVTILEVLEHLHHPDSLRALFPRCTVEIDYVPGHMIAVVKR